MARVAAPPPTDPTIPMRTVRIRPMRFGPGTMSRPRPPTTRPINIHPTITMNITASLSSRTSSYVPDAPHPPPEIWMLTGTNANLHGPEAVEVHVLAELPAVPAAARAHAQAESQ